MSEAFITFRETLEAALIVGILARYSVKEQYPFLWGGILSAFLSSVGVAFFLQEVTRLSALWEVLFSGVAAVLLYYMVIWMQRQSRSLSQTLRRSAQLSTGWLLFGLSFTAVVREGVETVLFLHALWRMQEGLSWIGGCVGVVGAVAVGIAIFIYGRWVPLRAFFSTTSILLLLIAAGMAAYTVHELLELLERYSWAQRLAQAQAWSLFPPTSSPPSTHSWIYTFSDGQFYPPLHHKGWIGGLLHVLTGWRASMSWIEVGVWSLTFFSGLWLWYRNRA